MVFRSHIEPFGDHVDAEGKRYSLSRVEARFNPRTYAFFVVMLVCRAPKPFTGRPNDIPEIMELWEKVVLSCIGETLFSDNSVVTGVKMSNKTKAKDSANKTQWRLEVWLTLDPEQPDSAVAGKGIKKEFEKLIGMLSKSVDYKKVD